MPRSVFRLIPRVVELASSARGSGRPLAAACALAALLATHAHATTTGYLNWANKTAAQAAPQQIPQAAPAEPQAAPSYDIPPSPYGQVGYPFRTLGWPSKDGVQTAQPQPQPAPQPAPQRIASQIPLQAAPVQTVPMASPIVQAAPASAPPPPPQPRTITQNGHTYVLPSSPPQAIEPEDDPVAGDDAAPAEAPPPAPPAMQASAPVRQTPPGVQPRDGGYQVPASSPYAARIAAARAAQPQPPAQTAAADAQPAAAVATAPAPAEPLATQETDHVFIPGEQWRSAADEPRFYSLHREYGYRPDPITVDRNATGALLETHYDTEDGDSDGDSGNGNGTDDKGSSGDDTQ